MFADIAKKVNAYKIAHPKQRVISLGIGDVTQPLCPAVIKAMHKAVDEMAEQASFRGYGPERGYDFLREAIIKNDFLPRGIHLDANEVFVNDGAKSDTGNIQEILRWDNNIGVTDPIYPVYIDSNVMIGRAGIFENGKWSNVTYMPCDESDDFIPQIPDHRVDMIYLCYPNNPTGTVISKEELRKWAPHGPAPRHVIHARTDGTDLPRMHDARQRAGVPRLHLAGHGPKRRSMQAPAQDPIRRRALQTRRHLQTGRARRARIHPARPRNRRRLQPVQRELPQHGRQNGTRRHPAGHTSPLRRIRQTSQRTPRIHAHRPRPRARRDDARRMDMVAHGQRSTRRTAIGATQSQGIPGRHRPVSAAHRRTRHANRSRQRTHERHRRRQPAATRQGLRTRTPGRRRGAQTTARHRRTVRTRRRQTPRRRAPSCFNAATMERAENGLAILSIKKARIIFKRFVSLMLFL